MLVFAASKQILCAPQEVRDRLSQSVWIVPALSFRPFTRVRCLLAHLFDDPYTHYYPLQYNMPPKTSSEVVQTCKNSRDE